MRTREALQRNVNGTETIVYGPTGLCLACPLLLAAATPVQLAAALGVSGLAACTVLVACTVLAEAGVPAVLT